jgi:hypothetical protein
MDRSVRPVDRSTLPPSDSSLGAMLGQTIDLAQQVASDELRLVQFDAQDRVIEAIQGGAWVGFGVFCLSVAWFAAWAAAAVALEDRFSLEARLAVMAISHLMLGTILIRFGPRGRRAAP